MKRKIIYHVGQTNSGKTFRAFESLAAAKSGVYLAPLRLLAWEGQQKLLGKHVVCDLITGQEKMIHQENKATHLSCTIESLNFQKQYDVCVIDEIQMIGDQQRGSAWTNAVLGVQAKEIHVCGDYRPLKILSEFCLLTGDTLEIVEHFRLSTLTVHTHKIFSLDKDLQEGDCIIGFDSMLLHKIKNRINRIHTLRTIMANQTSNSNIKKLLHMQKLLKHNTNDPKDQE